MVNARGVEVLEFLNMNWILYRSMSSRYGGATTTNTDSARNRTPEALARPSDLGVKKTVRPFNFTLNLSLLLKNLKIPNQVSSETETTRKSSVDGPTSDATDTDATVLQQQQQKQRCSVVVVPNKRGSHSSDTSSVFSDTMMSSPSMQANEGLEAATLGGTESTSVPFIDSDDEMDDAVRTTKTKTTGGGRGGKNGDQVDEETAHDADVDDDEEEEEEEDEEDDDDEDDDISKDRDEFVDNQQLGMMVDDDVLEENEEEDDEEDLVESMDVSIRKKL